MLATASLTMLASVSSATPLTVLALCLVAGIGTVLMLPGRREEPWRWIGGVVLATAGLIAAALLVRGFAGRAGMGVYFWIFSALAIGGALRVITHRRPVFSALYFMLTVGAVAGLFVLLWAEFMAAALVIIYAGAILITYVFVIMLAAQSSRQALGAVAECDAVSREPRVAAAVGFGLMAVLMVMIFDRYTPPQSQALSPALAAHFMPRNSAVDFVVPTTAPIADAAPLAMGRSSSGGESQVIFATTEPTGGAGHMPTSAAMPVASVGVADLGLYLFSNQMISLEVAALILTLAVVGAIVIARRRVPMEEGAFEPTRQMAQDVDELIGDDNPHAIPVYGTDNPRQKAFPER